ncbi:MAG: ATP-grasp domain-containing protein [Rhodomicrobium sp.]
MNNFRLLFCSDPLDPRKPDQAFAGEAEAARSCGLRFCLADHDALDREHDGAKAIRRIREEGPLNIVYRGWMLRAGDYRLLYDALAAASIKLINTPEQYSICHHAPESYPYAAAWSARTAWIDREAICDSRAIAAALSALGSKSAIVKDWVKSQAAGYWNEACFIPDVAHHYDAMRVISRFLELQGDSLTGGLVFREYVPLATANGQIQEWRAFILDGEPLGCWPRFSAIDAESPPDALIRAVARSIPARFAAADFALSQSGHWLLIEVGEGQVSSIPEAAPLPDIFHALAASTSGAI